MICNLNPIIIIFYDGYLTYVSYKKIICTYKHLVFCGNFFFIFRA